MTLSITDALLTTQAFFEPVQRLATFRSYDRMMDVYLMKGKTSEMPL